MGNKRKHEDELDFEIQFYEGILRNTPNFIQALVALGNVYTKSGFYEEGLKIDQKLVDLLPSDGVVHYNLACSYSLLGFIDLSFGALTKSIKLGYRDFHYMKIDPDLKNVRVDERFERLINSWQAKEK
jgi:tetratricopeptide (TPR) repeat protein